MHIYTNTGRGEAVLLVHGYGENRRVWDGVVNLLPKKYQYIIPALPGAGEQPVADPVTMELFADYLDEILEKEKIKQVRLIGHSMGGYIAMAFAKKHPGKITALGLIHSHVYADGEEQKQTRKKAIDFIRKNGVKTYLKDFVPNLFAGTTDKKIVTHHLKSVLDTPADGLTAALQAMILRSDTSDILKKIQVPVLFLFGKSDHLMPLQKMLKQCELPGKCMVEILEQSGHMSMLEETSRCAGVIREFLKWTEAE